MADCEGAFQTIDTNDRLLAQANYGALNNLDPTMVLAYDAKKVGALGAAGGVVTKGSDNALHVGDGGNADYMEMTGSGIEVALKLSDRLEKNVCDMTGAVFFDKDDQAAAQSAEALRLRFAPMLEVADDLRAQYGIGVIGLTRITERMVRAFIGKTVELAPDEDGTPRVGKFSVDSFVLPPRQMKVRVGGAMVDKVVPHSLGAGGYVTLKWGPYFAPTLGDNQKVIANASSANAGGFVSKETAAAAVAPIYGVDDVAGEVAKARDEGTEDAEKALAGAMGGVHAERAWPRGPPRATTSSGSRPGTAPDRLARAGARKVSGHGKAEAGHEHRRADPGHQGRLHGLRRLRSGRARGDGPRRVGRADLVGQGLARRPDAGPGGRPDAALLRAGRPLDEVRRDRVRGRAAGGLPPRRRPRPQG